MGRDASSLEFAQELGRIYDQCGEHQDRQEPGEPHVPVMC